MGTKTPYGLTSIGQRSTSYSPNMLSGLTNRKDSIGDAGGLMGWDGIGRDPSLKTPAELAEEARERAKAGGKDGVNPNLTAFDIYGDSLAGYEGVRDAATSAVSAAMRNDYLNSIIETQLTPAQQEAQLLGLSEQQSAGDLQTMIDSINSFKGQDESNQLAIDALLAGFSKKSTDDALKAKGVILGDAYPFPNQAMDSTEVTQDTVNDILGGAMAARDRIMGGTGTPTREQELAVQATVYDLLTDAGIGVEQSTINPYSLEGDALGRFVDRISVVDEVTPDAGGGGDTAASEAASEAASDGGGASTMDVPGDTGIADQRDIFRDYETNPDLYKWEGNDAVAAQIWEAIAIEVEEAIKERLKDEYELYRGEPYDPNNPPTPVLKTPEELAADKLAKEEEARRREEAAIALGEAGTKKNPLDILGDIINNTDFTLGKTNNQSAGTSTTDTGTANTANTATTGTATTGTGTTGTGTTGTGTTGTGTTGTGTTGTGTANTGGTGGGDDLGDGIGDGPGDNDGDGDGDDDGDGDGSEEAQELADIVSGGTGGGMRTVKTEKAGLADITNTYDPSLSLAENMALMLGTKTQEEDAVNSALMYGGGIVQPTDINAEISRILGSR